MKGANVTFALTAGSLPPGLTMPAQSSGSGTQLLCNAANGSFLIALAHQRAMDVGGTFGSDGAYGTDSNVRRGSENVPQGGSTWCGPLPPASST